MLQNRLNLEIEGQHHAPTKIWLFHHSLSQLHSEVECVLWGPCQKLNIIGLQPKTSKFLAKIHNQQPVIKESFLLCWQFLHLSVLQRIAALKVPHSCHLLSLGTITRHQIAYNYLKKRVYSWERLLKYSRLSSALGLGTDFDMAPPLIFEVSSTLMFFIWPVTS